MINKNKIPQGKDVRLAHLTGMSHVCSELIDEMLEIIQSGQVLTGDDCIALVHNKIEEIGEEFEGGSDE